MRLLLHQNSTYREHFERIESRFRIMLVDPHRFENSLGAGAKFTMLSDTENRISLFRAGYLSRELFNALLSGGEPFSSGPAAYIWKRLVDAQIILDIDLAMPRGLATHTLIKPLLEAHLAANTFPNLLTPTSELPMRYANAVVAVDVLTTSGDQARGTGFVVAGNPLPLIVTCAHNIRGDNVRAISKIATHSGIELPFANPSLSENLDLAFWSVPDFSEGPFFRLASDDPAIFDEVFTLGFPLIPRAINAPLINHRGEVNGYAELYDPKTLVTVISNAVSPGSSGCPVIRSDGFVVGMAMKWLEAEYGSERARYSAALPASSILSFIQEAAPTL